MKDSKLTRRPRRSTSSSTSSSPTRRKRSGSFSSQSSRPSYSSRSRSGGSRGSRNSKKSSNFDIERFIDEVNRKRASKTQTTIDKPVEITHKFSDFAIDDSLQSVLIKNGFETPTVIQDQAIPEILAGHDVVGIANTGTGKTLAFSLPLVHKALVTRDLYRVMIMTPTRELAQQVQSEINNLLRGNNPLSSVLCVGGMSIRQQIDILQKTPRFVIGTPGRLKDLIDRGKIDTSTFSVIVLDEADQMLDMGFVADMRYILHGFPDDHQTLLFSATFSDDIKRLVKDFAKSPKTISVRREETGSNIEQSVRRISRSEDKIEVLKTLLAHDKTEKTIVFNRTKRGADQLSRSLKAAGIKAEAIHGDKPQRLRTRILNRFKAHEFNVLVATDVAARGLDIDDITHVVNYDLPQSQDDYVHRIGRTGRAGKTGTAVSFI